jgi:hypothetical protein
MRTVFFVTNGLLLGANTTIGWMFFNQSAAVLGNVIGGAIFMGTSEHLMNHWQSRLPWEMGHAPGTLAAGDVESTRKAKEDRPIGEKQQMKDLVRVRSRNVSLPRRRASMPPVAHTATFPA